jgi:hypothetical protein
MADSPPTLTPAIAQTLHRHLAANTWLQGTGCRVLVVSGCRVLLSEALMPYLESVPRDADTGQRITANPLMLSMVVSVFEIRQGLGMPKTIHELYAVASSAMLARGGGAPGKQLQLLRAVFFEAHLAQRREIEDRQLDEAALQLEMPRTLAAIRECAELDTHFDEEAKT